MLPSPVERNYRGGPDDFTLTSWQTWDGPTVAFELTEETAVTVVVSVTGGAGAWGTLDDFQINVVG